MLPALTPDPLYLVGGTVRDLLLGSGRIKDVDLAMPSGSDAVARRFADAAGGSFFFLDEERRITRVVIPAGGQSIQYDFADFEGADLAADLARRDFTVNAMALELRGLGRTGPRTSFAELGRTSRFALHAAAVAAVSAALLLVLLLPDARRFFAMPGH